MSRGYVIKHGGKKIFKIDNTNETNGTNYTNNSEKKFTTEGAEKRRGKSECYIKNPLNRNDA